MPSADPIREVITHLSAVHQAHAEFVAKVAALKPHRIPTAHGAEEIDINLRELHIRTVMGYALRYVQALVDDTNEHLVHGAKVDFREFMSAQVDVLGDYLYAPLHAAAGATEANAEWVA